MDIDKIKSDLRLVKGAWKKIAEQIDVPVSWIHQIMDGRITDPGFKKIQKLDRFFKELG